MFRSLYYKRSSQESLDEEDLTIATQVHDELSCALMCSSIVACYNALFDKDSRKFSFEKATEKLNREKGVENKPQKILLEKVGIDERKSAKCSVTVETHSSKM